MDTIRLNLVLPKNLARELEEMTGPRKRSRFIAEAIERRLKEMHDEKLHSLMAEGYRANAAENTALAREFDAADMEGWDEY